MWAPGPQVRETSLNQKDGFSWVGFYNLGVLGGNVVVVAMIVERERTRYKNNYRSQLTTMETRDVSHCGLAIYINKYLKAKEEFLKLKYFTMQKYNP